MKTRVQQFSKLSDAELVEMYRKQDEESADAIEAVIVRYKNIVVSILRKLLHDIEEEQELMQALWLKVMEMILSGQYREQGKFNAWLVHIFYSNGIDAVRLRAKLALNRSMTAEQEALPVMDKKINHFETFHDLNIILGTMPEKYREVMSRYIVGMPVKAIAKQLGKNEGTTFSLNSRAKDYIRAFYLTDQKKYFMSAA
jgi:RNA polymerase sigma factor (sigma-70 family)